MILYRTPGRSFTRPPRTSTIECSWRLWPTPGMYAVTSMPVVSRTRATLRSAEFGFFGVWVKTRVQTPRRWGDPWSAGVFDFSGLVTRPLRTSCWMVGNVLLEPLLGAVRARSQVGASIDCRILVGRTGRTPAEQAR